MAQPVRARKVVLFPGCAGSPRAHACRSWARWTVASSRVWSIRRASVPWSLEMKFPEPFATLLDWMSVTQPTSPDVLDRVRQPGRQLPQPGRGDEPVADRTQRSNLLSYRAPGHERRCASTRGCDGRSRKRGRGGRGRGWRKRGRRGITRRRAILEHMHFHSFHTCACRPLPWPSSGLNCAELEGDKTSYSGSSSRSCAPTRSTRHFSGKIGRSSSVTRRCPSLAGAPHHALA